MQTSGAEVESNGVIQADSFQVINDLGVLFAADLIQSFEFDDVFSKQTKSAS